MSWLSLNRLFTLGLGLILGAAQAQPVRDAVIRPSATEIRPGVYLREHVPPERYDECNNCHRKKEFLKVPDKKKTTVEHQFTEYKHGNKVMSCNFCHDKNNHDFLRSSAEYPAGFTHPSGVCRQCHMDIYRDWSGGIHGKRVGGWNRESIQFNCVDCHNPHNVKFKQMKALPAPQMPKFGIPKMPGSH